MKLLLFYFAGTLCNMIGNYAYGLSIIINIKLLLTIEILKIIIVIKFRQNRLSTSLRKKDKIYTDENVISPLRPIQTENLSHAS